MSQRPKKKEEIEEITQIKGRKKSSTLLYPRRSNYLVESLETRSFFSLKYPFRQFLGRDLGQSVQKPWEESSIWVPF